MTPHTEPAAQAQAELTSYLAKLSTELADVPLGARDEILADVKAHANDALEAGQPLDQVLAGFGTPHQAATQFRSELGLPERDEMSAAHAFRAATMLHGASVVVAVLTGCFVAFLMPSFTTMARGSAQYTEATVDTIVGTYGLGPALIAFIPALLAVLPLVLPQLARMPVAIANAAVVALLAAVTFASVGMFYVPLAVMMWAAAVVPWRIAHGLDVSKSWVWRIFGGVLLVLPGLLLISGMVSGAIWPAPGAIAMVLAALALSALFIIGWRASFYIVAAIGFAVMVLSMIDLGLMTLAAWWVGGAYLVVGLTAVATLRPRGQR